MRLSRHEWILLAVNAAYLSIFATIAWQRGNDEFLFYGAVIVALGGLLVWVQPRVKFEPAVLWGLTLWGLAHMAGGSLKVKGDVLYGLILVNLVPSLGILRYDQIVHIIGFGVAALMCFHLLKPHLRADVGRSAGLLFLVILMGSGLGAINEILEFIAVLLFPQTNVGGYTNTAMDLCCNLIGGTLAVLIFVRRGALSG